MHISVVINTYNAQFFLERTLESVKEYDEILICDMYSEDDTVKIAKRYNANIVFHEKTGYVEPARNFAIAHAKFNWILLLDADEVVHSDLKEFIIKKISEDSNITSISIPRKNYFLGKFMRSAYPDQGPRFFKKDKVFWPEHIHSAPQIQGFIYKINPAKKNLAIEHLADDSVKTIIQKTNTYTDAELSKRKNQNVHFAKLIYSPLFWFIKYYFIKQGFRDGIEGFIFSALKAQYKFVTLIKLWELKKTKQRF